MYKPVPFFRPTRKREASICALMAHETIAAIFLSPVFGWLTSVERGSYFGTIVGIVVVLSASQTNEKKIIPTVPVLWDREIDA